MCFDETTILSAALLRTACPASVPSLKLQRLKPVLSYLKQHRLPSAQIPYHVKYLPPELDPVLSFSCKGAGRLLFLTVQRRNVLKLKIGVQMLNNDISCYLQNNSLSIFLFINELERHVSMILS